MVAMARPDTTSGSGALPELELDVRPGPAPRARPTAAALPVEAPLELAVDPRALVMERAASDLAVASGPPSSTAATHEDPIAADAMLLADYGAPPRRWFLTPLYAWRVLTRRRELRRALTGRREESARADAELDDALVAFVDRARETAECAGTYATALEDLDRAEQRLRSCDQVLAAEQDAHTARLAQADSRLASLESELAQAEEGERGTGAELVAVQEALVREDARLKRAEVELRAVQQRAGDGSES